jgi:hypothetical protein
MTRLLLIAAAVVATLGFGVPAASAAPAPCIQYNDPIHLGSYPICPLDLLNP